MQQNYYYNIQSLLWFYNSKNSNYNSSKKLYVFGLFVFSVLLVLFNIANLKFHFYFINLLFLVVLFIIINNKLNFENLKKPLVVTKRVSRLIITNFLLMFCLYFCILYVGFKVSCWYIILLIPTILSSGVIATIANLLNRPIEIIIQQFYIFKAKQKLKTYNELIVVGITGSYGKTSTKNYLCEILKQKYSVLCTPASYNTPMGITKTILNNLKPYHQILILEMGADHKNDINRLCKIVKPDIAIITAVGEQHLKTFRSLENIIKTKYQLVLNTKPDGFFVTNTTNPICQTYANNSQIQTYTVGNANNCFCKLLSLTQNNENMVINFSYNNIEYHLETSLIGEYNAINILLAVVVALKLGVDINQIKCSTKLLKSVEHRLQVKKLNNGAIMIDDSFNSNPLGCKMAINALNNFNMKKYVITCGMVELGEKQFEENYKFGTLLANVTEVVIVNNLNYQSIAMGVVDAGGEKPKLFGSFKLAYDYISSKLDSNSVLLIENDLSDCYIV